MRVEYGHAHAYTRYSLLGKIDYVLLFRSVIETKLNSYKSLTVHLPFEIQHEEVQNIEKALRFIKFGEIIKKLFKVKLYWENAPWLNYGKWNLKHKNTNWKDIPTNIDICLDTGHLMLGAVNKIKFLDTLKSVLDKRESQIKHLHLHENDFKTDKHIPVPGKVISKSTFDSLTKNRTYIVERGD